MNKVERVNFIKYIGGKHYMLNNIYKNLDTTKECFIDLFGGSGKVILNLPYNYKVLIYNDKNDDLSNLFMQVKNNFEEFKKAVELPYSEILFKSFYEKYNSKNYENSLEKAVVFYYLSNVSFGGKCQSFSYSFTKKEALAYHRKIEKLHIIYERLKRITLLSKDYKEILESILNKEDIMLYADPPYVGTEYYYDLEFNEKDHKELAEYLNKLKCSVMLSYYYFDGIEEMYPRDKWHYQEFSQFKHVYGFTKNNRNDKKRPRSIELIITNYKTKGELL